ncbi:TlpA disulfide reductase family protein [Ekhidna sp.]|uniref:TlpA family protein disulfide reductase n=1 Tax=Ekhidna sp. TaxID=2608089 RepID=UPI0032EBE992
MKKKIKKELIEWVILISIIGVIYFTGWHTELIGRVQQAVLATGIIQPSIIEEEKTASYDFWLEDLEGDRISFDSFKNEIVFINFWATWCPPCIAEMPDIHELYKSENDQVRFVMISLDKDENKAREFIKDKKFDFPVYFLRSSLPDSYDTHSIPTTYVLDKIGTIKVENHGMAKYNTEKFKDLLSELASMQ